MSGDTEEMTMDAKSVDSALIWTDNPELEYFRSMMTNRIDDKLASGLNLEDSLIGDSTVREMLEDDDGLNSRKNSSPLRRFGERDTSGLSDAESSTVDNIFIGDESIFAMKKTLNLVYDDGTIETPEDGDLIPPIQPNQNQLQKQEPNVNTVNQQPNYQSEPHVIPPPNRQPTFVAPPQLNIPHIDRSDVNAGLKESANIPGFIFVTDGHPSIINTSPNHQSGKTSKRNGKGEQKGENSKCLRTSLIICLTLVIIIAAIVIALLVIVVRPKASGLTSSSSQTQNDGSPFSSPIAPPTAEPSSLRANDQPQIISGRFTFHPIADELQPTSPEPSEIVINPEPSEIVNEPTTMPTRSSVLIPEDSTNSDDAMIPITTPVNLVPPTPTDSNEDPPKASSESPTISSTAVSSDASSCLSTIASDKTCYSHGENIQISFNNCNSTSTDWIGIYPARRGVSNLISDPIFWTWTCGDQICSSAVDNGEATMYNVSRSGNYRALLFRDDDNNGAGYSAYAVGNRFLVSSSRCNQ